jgi:hypothetical protein
MMKAQVPALREFANEVKARFTDVMLLNLVFCRSIVRHPFAAA